jgi:hypothetical protein
VVRYTDYGAYPAILNLDNLIFFREKLSPSSRIFAFSFFTNHHQPEPADLCQIPTLRPIPISRSQSIIPHKFNTLLY